MRRLAIVACVGLLVSGCASRNLLRVDGAGPAIENPDTVRAVNLVVALNPAGLPAEGQHAVCLGTGSLPDECKNSNFGDVSAKRLMDLIGFDEANSATSRNESLTRERARLEAALAAFYDSRNDTFGSQEDRRNRLQSRLVGASEDNCKVFAQTIYGTQASTNFLFGGLTTALSGAGAITTNQQTARLLSGLAGISSGLRSEANEDFFRKQWMEAVVKAIDSSRGKMKLDMATRRALSISEYPVEAAIADAIEFNGECSLVAGMKEVNAAVTIADDPAGMKALRSAFRESGFDIDLNVKDRRDMPEGLVGASGVSNGAPRPPRHRPGAQSADAIVSLDSSVQKVRARIPTLVAQAQAKHKADKNADMPATEVATLRSGLDAIAANLANDSGAALQPSFAALTQYASKSATMNAELAGLTDEDARNAKLAEIRANDAKASADLTLALHMVASVEKALVAKAGI